MHQPQDEEWRDFGDLGTYIEDVERIINHIHYSKNIYGASGPACPIKDGGCGGPVVRLETIWLRNSDERVPLNDLGRTVAPPRKPRLSLYEPRKPAPCAEPSRPPKPTYDGYQFQELDKERSGIWEKLIGGTIGIAIATAFVSACVIYGIAAYLEAYEIVTEPLRAS